MDEAEERTSAYYCIPPYRWQQLRYDLVTRQDYEWEPLPDETLARVQQLHLLRPMQDSIYDFYRIQLNDPGIITAAHRENLGPDFYPFLLYILTHEMVHLVRLSTILSQAEDLRPSMEEEESRVQKVAYRILSKSPDKDMRPILSKFCAHESSAAGLCDIA